MELFEKIKEMRTAALKTGDKFLHSVLTNVYSDAKPVGNNTTTPEDNTVLSVLKKHLDGVVDTLNIMREKGFGDMDGVLLKEREKEILEGLMPGKLDEAALAKLVQELAPANLKAWMAHLKENFHARYDGKVAKAVFEATKV